MSIIRYFGFFLVLLGLFLNEYFLTALFSNDGVLETSSRIVIYIVDFFLVVFGSFALFSKKFDLFLLGHILWVKPRFREILFYLIFCIFFYKSLVNIRFTLIDYISNNISIREAFYFDNDVNNKGTHWGGYKFRETVSNNSHMLRYFWRYGIGNVFDKVTHISDGKSKFNKENEIIDLLYDISARNNSFKIETAIYIPKTLKTFWDMSCDTHMTPFIVPSISNIAMIGGLPSLNRNSCYTHLDAYGYSEYYETGKSALNIPINKERVCEKGKLEGFKRVIVFMLSSDDELVTETYECDE